MGLSPSSIKLLIQYDKKYKFNGPVLSLGNQEIWASHADLKNYFTDMGSPYKESKTIVPHTSYTFLSDPTLAKLAKDFVHARVFFEMMGINDYADMDKFDSDKPTHQHDMNLPVQNGLLENYSLILDGGTIEHVFDVRQVLENIVKMLKPGGCVVHICSYSIDHGFYGLSPCLFYDYYSANGFEDFTCHILQVDFRNFLKTYRNKNDYFEYKYGMNIQNLLDANKQPLIFFVARKVAHPNRLIIPTQGIYKNRFMAKFDADMQINQLLQPKPVSVRFPGFAFVYKVVNFVRDLVLPLKRQKNSVLIKKI